MATSSLKWLILASVCLALLSGTQGMIHLPQFNTKKGGATGTKNLEQCLDKNPLMPQLKAKGVEIFQIPFETKKSCGGAFSKGGTCCNINDARKLLEDQKNHAMAVTEELFEEFGMVIEAFSTTREKIKKNLLVKAFKKVFKAKDSEKLDKYEGELRDFRQQIIPLQQKCTRKIMDFRAHSLCQICSNDSMKYFKEGRAKVSDEKCTEVLMHCVGAWRLMMKLIRRLKHFRIIGKFMDAFRSKKNKRFKVSFDSTDQIDDFFQKFNLRETVKHCENVNDCQNKDKRLICDRLISILQPMLVEAAQKAIIKREDRRLQQESYNSCAGGNSGWISSSNEVLTVMTTPSCCVGEEGSIMDA